MKTKNMLFGMMLMASASLGFTSCNNSPIVEDEYFEKSAAIPTITDFPELVSGEEAGILLMREEEKMAHDVYVVLGQTTDLVIFDNIASSFSYKAAKSGFVKVPSMPVDGSASL